MLDIDPRIFEYKIKTYENVKPVQQKLHLVNPRKVTTIKAEVKTILKDGFIYHVSSMEYVSNLVPIENKQGIL